MAPFPAIPPAASGDQNLVSAASKKEELDPVVVVDEEEAELPTVDLSKLAASAAPEDRRRELLVLRKACEEYNFFMVVNHGVPDKLRDAMVRVAEDYFTQTPEEEKKKNAKGAAGTPAVAYTFDPVTYGSGYPNTALEGVAFRREYIRLYAHPTFHSPEPEHTDFTEVLRRYTTSVREVAEELLKAIWESLEIEEGSINEALGMESCTQIVAINFYPPPPAAAATVPGLGTTVLSGIPPQTDHGLLTVVHQNGVAGFQVPVAKLGGPSTAVSPCKKARRGGDGMRVSVGTSPTAFVINLGDQMEVVSNGRYKSALHRADVVNAAGRARVSVASVVGPSLDAVVVPAAAVAEAVGEPAAFLKYILRIGSDF